MDEILSIIEGLRAKVQQLSEERDSATSELATVKTRLELLGTELDAVIAE